MWDRRPSKSARISANNPLLLAWNANDNSENLAKISRETRWEALFQFGTLAQKAHLQCNRANRWWRRCNHALAFARVKYSSWIESCGGDGRRDVTVQ